MSGSVAMEQVFNFRLILEEHLDDLGVELRAAVAFNFFDGLLDRKRPSIAAV